MSRIIKGAAVDGDPLELKFRETLVTKQEIVVEQPSPEEQAKTMLSEAQRQAATIVADAQQKADQLTKAARAEAEELKIQAQEQGYRDGLQQAETEAAQIRLQAQQVLEQAETVRKETFAAMEQEIVSLAVEIAEKFLTTQLQLDPDLVVEAAKEALQQVKDREQVTIYVNPEDIGAYIGRKPELTQMLSDRARLSIIADAKVKLGGCLVQTEQGVVDATADARWQEILKALFPA
ncbi:FliH/SctL family protein [Peptococcaceae bacterium 1198_IL3148]